MAAHRWPDDSAWRAPEQADERGAAEDPDADDNEAAWLATSPGQPAACA
jgi:hypothetical protein